MKKLLIPFLLLLIFAGLSFQGFGEECKCDAGTEGTCMIVTVNGHCSADCSTESQVAKDCKSSGGGGNIR